MQAGNGERRIFILKSCLVSILHAANVRFETAISATSLTAVVGREGPVGLAPGEWLSWRIVRHGATVGALFSKDKHLHAREALFLAAILRKSGASRQPPMAYFE